MAQPSLPSAMKAWQYSSTKGGLEKNLKLNPSAPVPKPNSNQHLIKVIATALNPVDYKPNEMMGAARFAFSKPATPGLDFAGTIVTPAPGSPLKPGQLVFGCCGGSLFNGGGLSEFAVAGTDSTVALPDGVNPVDGATVGVAGYTAYQSIIPHVKEGDKVFINGGSGGTGIFGIQFAKAIGCHVTTTCSTPNVDLCKRLGADTVIDYKKENVLDSLRKSGIKYDHAVDNVGTSKELIWQNHEFTQRGALYILVGVEPSLASLTDGLKRKIVPGFLGGLKRKVMGFWPKQNCEDLQQMGDWMAKGTVKAVIDQKFAFSDAPQAVERMKTGRARGKIVIDVTSER